MIKPIVTYDIESDNNPAVLTNITRTITDFKAQEVIECIQDLNDTLDNLIKEEGNKRGAIGLSATQIGIDLAITAVTLGNDRYVLINPELIEENGKQRLFRIGCFSLYKYRAMVRYNDDVVIEYYDPDGNKNRLSLKGDRSCVVQHEMDHLLGDLLFANLPNKEKDLFIPREAMYKDGKVSFKNNGLVFEIRRRLNLNKIINPPEFYSSLFNDYTDYKMLVDKTVQDNQEFIEFIKKHISVDGKILEISGGTGALAIYFNRDYYHISCLETDQDMLDLALRINQQNSTNVNYRFSSVEALPYEDKEFDVIFAKEIIETFADEEMTDILKEIFRIADKLIFKVPTINIKSNELKGNEHLRSIEAWRDLIVELGFAIIETKADDGYLMMVVTE